MALLHRWQLMLQHDGLWDGKILTWWLSSARANVPMEAGGRFTAFYNKALEVTQSFRPYSIGRSSHDPMRSIPLGN